MDRIDKLQEIKGRINELFNYEKASDDDWYYMKKEHIDWLIEQAEKVDYWVKQHRKRLYELENVYFKIQLMERQLQQTQAKVERYEGVLKFYADEETYETKFATDTDEIHDSFTLIELDGGKKARKVLKEFS